MNEDAKGPLMLGVVGAGRLGRTILATWPECVVAVGTRNRENLPSNLRDRSSEPASVLSIGDIDLLWLAVPDDHIHSVSRDIVHRMEERLPGAVIHSSGAQGVAPLSPFLERGIPVGALHPNLIVDGAGPFPDGAVWGYTGDESLLDICKELLLPLDPEIVQIEEQDRTSYHAAATLAANYPLLLFETAERLYETVGLSERDARSVVTSYVHQILGALVSGDERGTLEFLTGPVVRRDDRTLDRHIEAVVKDLGVQEAELLQRLIEFARNRLDELGGREPVTSRR